jgi:hypothetical protein
MNGRKGQRSVRPAVEALEARDVPTVNFYGGNLLPHVEAQALYYGSAWATVPAYANQAAALNVYLATVTGGAYMDALTRAGYGVGRGTATPGAIDTGAAAANTLISDASIQARIQADVRSGLLRAPDANRLYVVYVEPNVAVNLGGGEGTTQQGILGYHGAFGGVDAAGHAATIRYAVVAYPGGTVHNSGLGTSAFDQLTEVSSHELAEAVTDPDVDYARLGWYDPRWGEIGDITEDNPNALVRLNGYLVQEVADRNDQLLALAASAPPSTPAPPAPAPGTGATTTTLTAGPVRWHYHHHFWSATATATLTVTVAPRSGQAAPDGTVDLLYNGTVLGTARVQVVNGVATATFDVVFSGSGNYTFTARYRGAGQFQGSTSSAVTVAV